MAMERISVFPVYVVVLYEEGRFPTPPHGRTSATKNAHACTHKNTKLRQRNCVKAKWAHVHARPERLHRGERPAPGVPRLPGAAGFRAV